MPGGAEAFRVLARDANRRQIGGRSSRRHVAELLVFIAEACAFESPVQGRPLHPRGEMAPVGREDGASVGMRARRQKMSARSDELLAAVADQGEAARGSRF